jgi:diguanylate cyclase
VSGGVIQLDLERLGCPEAAAGVPHSFLDEALGALHEWLSRIGEHFRADACTQVDQCRAALQAQLPTEQLRPLLDDCLAAVTMALAHFEREQRDGRAEISTLVAIVRDAVETVVGGGASLDANLESSADRFAAAVQFNDIHQIKKQIMTEVSTLKRVISDRRMAWDTNVALLNERVALLERQLKTTRQEATLDALTHVANRRAFDQTLREWMAPDRPGFVLAVLDVDEFKTINDTLGHAVGDQALIKVTRSLTASVRGYDLVARLGGDEFALLMSGLTLRQAEYRLKTIVAAIATSEKSEPGDPEVNVTVSAGAAEFSAGDTAASLMQRADRALYTAKRLGRNRAITKPSPLIADLMSRR